MSNSQRKPDSQKKDEKYSKFLERVKSNLPQSRKYSYQKTILLSDIHKEVKPPKPDNRELKRKISNFYHMHEVGLRTPGTSDPTLPRFSTGGTNLLSKTLRKNPQNWGSGNRFIPTARKEDLITMKQDELKRRAEVMDQIKNQKVEYRISTRPARFLLSESVKNKFHGLTRAPESDAQLFKIVDGTQKKKKWTGQNVILAEDAAKELFIHNSDDEGSEEDSDDVKGAASEDSEKLKEILGIEHKLSKHGSFADHRSKELSTEGEFKRQGSLGSNEIHNTEKKRAYKKPTYLDVFYHKHGIITENSKKINFDGLIGDFKSDDLSERGRLNH